MFGTLIDQDYKFMRQRIRVYSATNRKVIKEIAKSYFKSKVTDYLKWITNVKSMGRADVLVLFLLCKLTKKNYMVHLNENRYWSTLLDEPDTHDDFLLRCDLHLAYIGKGIYAQLVPRLELMDYAIFIIAQPEEPLGMDMKPLIVGSLTADEDKTLNYLLNTGISCK